MFVKFAHVIRLTSSDFVKNLVLRFSQNLFFDCNVLIILNFSFPLYQRLVIHWTKKILTKYRGRSVIPPAKILP